MKQIVFKRLRFRLILLALLASLIPLVILGAVIYFQFAGMYRDKVAEQIRYRAEAQARAVDLFLKERTAILATIVDTQPYETLCQESFLSDLLKIMNLRVGAFLDLGVIDGDGRHRAYVGPYNLKGLNYDDQPWFDEVMRKGVCISDIFMGFRRLPHFIIAVRRQENGGSWILRATIDPDVLRDIVRNAKTGKTGDAFIVNRAGVYQTRPRFFGDVLWESHIETPRFGGDTSIVAHTDSRRGDLLMAGTWLENADWLLVISQTIDEETQSLTSAKNLEILILAAGLGIVVLAVFGVATFLVKQHQAEALRTDEQNARLMQSEKLAALGKMASGIAHEINAPITVIAEKTGRMRELLHRGGDAASDQAIAEPSAIMEAIEAQVERVRKIVYNMTAFTRRMEPRTDNVDINAVLDQTLSLLQNYARMNNIETDRHLGADLPVIVSDQSELQQVFLNLISNAIDAVGKNGRIELATRRAGETIEIDIRDNGPGIPKANLNRIFDPFFTTRNNGKGSGLGLSITRDIVEKMGGDIFVESTEGKGTRFTVRLPATFPESTGRSYRRDAKRP